MSRPPRLRDVAERAEVSVALVSSFINTPQLVGRKNAARIARAIEELHFVPNGTARQLRRGVSRMIGFVAFGAGTPFFSSVARGAQARASEAGLYLVLADTDGGPELEREYLALLEEQRVRGVILAPRRDQTAHLDGLRRSGIPTVLIGQTGPDESWSSVVIDNVRGGREAVEHLLSLGRRKIAVVGGEADTPQVSDRRRGAEEAVRAVAGATVTVIDTAAPEAAAVRVAATALLRLADRPDAVFCLDDTLAAGVLQVLAEHGVRVPEDIAVIGYDDTGGLAGVLSLSTVAPPREAVGAAAVELLLEELDPTSTAPRRHIVFGPELVIRRSTAG